MPEFLVSLSAAVNEAAVQGDNTSLLHRIVELEALLCRVTDETSFAYGPGPVRSMRGLISGDLIDEIEEYLHAT